MPLWTLMFYTWIFLVDAQRGTGRTTPKFRLILGRARVSVVSRNKTRDPQAKCNNTAIHSLHVVLHTTTTTGKTCLSFVAFSSCCKCPKTELASPVSLLTREEQHRHSKNLSKRGEGRMRVLCSTKEESRGGWGEGLINDTTYRQSTKCNAAPTMTS